MQNYEFTNITSIFILYKNIKKKIEKSNNSI